MTASSIEAHEFMLPLAVAMRFRILLFLRDHQTASCSDLEEALGAKHQSMSSRLDELTLMCLVTPDFGRRDRADLPSESLYGLTPEAVVILSFKQRAYGIVARLGTIHTEQCDARAEVMRAVKREWRTHISDACRAEIFRLVA